jgi:hypothetical protein
VCVYWLALGCVATLDWPLSRPPLALTSKSESPELGHVQAGLGPCFWLEIYFWGQFWLEIEWRKPLTLHQHHTCVGPAAS